MSPAREIYDAFQDAAKTRRNRKDWIEFERAAVFNAAADYCTRRGIAPVTIEQVMRSETSATGHSDYGAKWAYGIAREIERNASEGSRK